MEIPVSREVRDIYSEGRDIAVQSRRSFDSAYLLLAMFTVPNRGVSVLEERRKYEGDLIDAMAEHMSTEESPQIVKEIQEKTQQIAAGCSANLINTLHLLVALSRVRNSQAYRVLTTVGLDPAEVRNASIALLQGPVPNHPTSRRRRPGSISGHRHAPFTGGGMGATPDGGYMHGEPEPDFMEPATLTRPTIQVAEPEVMQEAGAPPAEREPQRRSSVPWEPETPYSLNPEEFPHLVGMGRNLTEAAYLGLIDPMVGRDEELNQVLDILQKRRSNNPCLIGDPGVGKTALVEGVARRMAGVDEDQQDRSDRILVELNTAGLLAGTQLRGAFAERLGAIKEEVRRAEGRVIIFIDEIHTLIGAGAGDGPLDASNDLKSALARGEFPCVGATTFKEYTKYIESDAALERRFQPVVLGEPSFDETLEIMKGIVETYEEHHDVAIHGDALEAAIRLSSRYITDRRLPDKAINVVDLACSRARRLGQKEVEDTDMAEVVAAQIGLPVEKLVLKESERLLQLEDFLAERIIGQPNPVRRIAEVIRRNFAGFNSHRPMGSFLLVGPTGVGKTETVKVLADFLFQNRDAVLRFDMSEYSESHAVSKLIGSPPGYVGHDDGGQLTDAVHKRPYQVLLFDEIEKANPEVWNLLLQLLEEGVLTDARGRKVFFSHTVVFLTSNLGAEVFDQNSQRSIGFGGQEVSAEDQDEQLLSEVRKRLPPELWNRIEDKEVFRPLKKESVAAIAKLLLAQSSERLSQERHIQFEVDEELVAHLIEEGGYDAQLGARPMRHTIQRIVEGAIADHILAGLADTGDTLLVTAREGEIEVDVREERPPAMG